MCNLKNKFFDSKMIEKLFFLNVVILPDNSYILSVIWQSMRYVSNALKEEVWSALDGKRMSFIDNCIPDPYMILDNCVLAM